MSFRNILSARSDFPALTQKVNGKDLIYLDSAASALKPQDVIDRLTKYYSFETANVHRGAHYLANQGTDFYESARDVVRIFLNAKSTEEIIFTKGTTESLNLVAWCMAKMLPKGSKILITEMEHHANFVPWLMITSFFGLHLEYVQIDEFGHLNFDDLKSKLKGASLLSITHASNTLGAVLPIKEITSLAHAEGCLVCVDGAQWVASGTTNIVDLDVDFYAFSSHKLFGPYGHGVLYGKKEHLDNMTPYQGGGGMIDQVDFGSVTFQETPYKFEAGTPHIPGAVGLQTAIEYIAQFNSQDLQKYEASLVNKAIEGLQEIKGVHIWGPKEERVPLVSFTISDLHHSDVGAILDQQGIAVRVGHHCTQPLLKKLGITGTIRASFSIYNSEDDVTRLIAATRKAKEILS